MLRYSFQITFDAACKVVKFYAVEVLILASCSGIGIVWWDFSKNCRYWELLISNTQ